VFQKHGFTIVSDELESKMTYKEFMEYVYCTGGVPRYLSWIATRGEEEACVQHLSSPGFGKVEPPQTHIEESQTQTQTGLRTCYLF
jgi:hypothetical protein